MEEKWKGSYYIHEILINGSYKIKTEQGNILKTPINRELLQKYNDKRNFISYIII